MGVEISGFDEMSNKLDNMVKNAEKISGEHSYEISEILSDSFMQKNTRFSNANLFLSEIGIYNNDDLEAYPDDKMDAYVSKETDFSTWQDMLGEAAREFVTKQLGL